MLLSLVLAIGLAAASQDALAEPMCVYSQIVDANRAGRPIPGPKEAMAPCQTRYGWDEISANRALEIAMGMLAYQDAGRNAQSAGVNMAIIDSVYDSFSAQEIASFGMPGKPVPAGSEATINAMVGRLLARGMSKDHAKLANRVLIARAVSQNQVVDFLAHRNR